MSRSAIYLRLSHAALCLATIAALVVVWMLVPTASAWAYVDPSVMTYTIQAVAGVAVALSAVFGVVFRRTRRKIYQIFNIDENANKAVEHSIERIDPAAPDAAERIAAAQAAAKHLREESDDAAESRSIVAMSWRKRFAFALLMSVFMFFMVFVAPAIELVGSNTDSMVFSLGNIWWVPVVFCTAFAIILALALSALKGKRFYIALMVVFALTAAAYIQSLFFNRGMLPADGGFIGWTEPFFIMKDITSGAMWIAVIVALLVLSRKRRHLWLKSTTAVACALIIMQAVGVASVAIKANEAAIVESQRPYVTQGSLRSVAPQNNVIVFVLDTYDTAILEAIRAEDPNFLDDFTDFTYFRDCAGTMIPTTNAIPNLLTGLKPAVGQTVEEYRATKYERSTYLEDIHNLNYSIGIYTDSLMMDFKNSADYKITTYTENVHPVSRAPINVWRTFIAMEQMALYREAPWVFKPAFWYYTSDVNNRMIADSGSANLNDSLYELDDAAILKLFQEQGLEVVDDGHEGAFRFIHLFGAHFPYSVDEEGGDVGTGHSDIMRQSKGSMKVVSEYMARLKELGLYDDATIIVTADHGVWTLSEDPVSRPISPIMLVKPSKTDGTQGQKVRVSAMPISHDDVIPTVIAAMGGDSSKYGPTVWEITDKNRDRYFDALTNVGGDGQRFVEYKISGYVLNLNNWEKTGNEWTGA